MEGEIVNRVANSKLLVFDLEDYYPTGRRIVFDIKDWLYEGLVLREKMFREYAAAHDWRQYQDSYVALTCSADAIIPGWTFMLLTMHLQPYAKKVVVGELEQLETAVFQDIIGQLDIEMYRDQSVIIKGCGNKPIPSNAYILLSQKLRPVAKSIMYGEACSSVPLYKRK